MPQDPSYAARDAGAGHSEGRMPLLVLGALGVVYGDIGTSPIYAFRQALSVGAGTSATEREVLGLLSLIVWALTLTVAVKYIFFVTRADNNGEGGTLSLMELARKTYTRAPRWITGLGVIGAALFFGDALITPAISVLSAVEGVKVVAPQVQPLVVPLTMVIIVLLFFVQRFGTERVSVVFGPVIGVWFAVLGVSGLVNVIEAPVVLWAFNPWYGVHFLATHQTASLVVLGAVFLAVTGAEALYADMGHFGRRPIVLAWFGLVFPCLLMNYFGQGAFVLSHGAANVTNPFFEMQPDWFLIPFIGLATLATVIASQAVISGTYSLARQAIALNILPRMTEVHTSATQSGQVYMPQINMILMLGVLVLVPTFGSSDALSHAYGIAVSSVMVVTLCLLAVVILRTWKWPIWAVAIFAGIFAVIDGGFLVANVTKVSTGGWVPLAIAGFATGIMAIWITGRALLAERTRRDEMPLQALVDNLARAERHRVPGTAVFLTANAEGAPTALMHSLKHYKVLHEKNVILTVETSASPRVPDAERIRIEVLNDMFMRVAVTFGYMDTPNLSKALILARRSGWKFDIMSTSFFLSRRTLVQDQKGGPLTRWRNRVFVVMARNAEDATVYFHIPTGRVVEIGTQVLI